MTGLPNQRYRSFAQAVLRYDGTKDYEQAENFLTAARKYKAMKNLLDIDALRSLPFILKGAAAAWWDENKVTISTWNDFETEFRKTFAPTKPAYIIYQEIAQMKQKPDELTERYVTKQRALLNELSPPLAESQQLDMIYAFMEPKIQELIPRECIQSYAGLLEAARELERDKSKDNSQVTSTTDNRTGRKRVRCNFCRYFGHTVDTCRKKQKLVEEAAACSLKTTTESPASPEPMSSEVTPSSPVKEVKPSSPVNDSKNVSLNFDIRSLLMIEISIGTAKEMAFVDTGADTSIASHKLYSYLKNIGFHFTEKPTTITLADGIRKPQTVLTGRIPVKLKDRCILTNFTVLPNAENCKTLLGCEFFVDGNIELNLPQLAWRFNDEPGVYYDLIEEDSLNN